MDEAEYCDRLGLVYRGELVAMGSPSALKAGIAREGTAGPSLEDVFVSIVEEKDRRAGPLAGVRR
jgi:ABC-2 type transport system ATP-binding protein